MIGLPARAALVTGLCVRHDAISASVASQAEVLRHAGVEVTVFAQGADDTAGPDAVVLDDPWKLSGHPRYRNAELVIAHFGIAYRLFDVLMLDHASAATVVHFHNVTPSELLTGPAREQAHLGTLQMAVAERADVVWVDSPFNGRTLCHLTAVDPEVVRWMPLRVPAVDSATVGRTRSGDVTKVLCIGRFVPAKGQLDLLDALDRLGAPDRERFDVTLVGATAHADPGYLAEIRRRVQERGAGLTLCEDAPEDQLERLLADTDLLVSPSHHEGFCVPVIEGLAAGAGIIVTDAGALPETAGGLGRVVPVGDAPALAAALLDAAGAPQQAGRVAEVRRHIAAHGSAAFADRLMIEAAAASVARRLRPGARRRFAQRQAALLDLLVCPHCRAGLDRAVSAGDDVVGTASLSCARHGAVGAVRGHRPSFLERELDAHRTTPWVSSRIDVDGDLAGPGQWYRRHDGIATGRAGDRLLSRRGEGGTVSLVTHPGGGRVQLRVAGIAVADADLDGADGGEIELEVPAGGSDDVVELIHAGPDGSLVHLAHWRRWDEPSRSPVPVEAPCNRGNPYPPRFLDLLSRLPPHALVLDCGGGDRRLGDPRVINLEYLEYTLPDLYADGLALPFADGTFDLVLSQAVLEHVPDPQAAADELIRVTRPGGLIYTEIAFMQPLHAVPYHFMNVTPHGIRHLFAGLDVIDAGEFGGLGMTFRWFADLVGARAKVGEAEVEGVLAILDRLDEAMTAEELSMLASAVYLLGRRPLTSP